MKQIVYSILKSWRCTQYKQNWCIYILIIRRFADSRHLWTAGWFALLSSPWPGHPWRTVALGRLTRCCARLLYLCVYCLLKVDEHGYSLTCTSAACHALQDRSQAKIAALSCRISVLEQQLEDIIVNLQQQQLSVTCLHDGDDNVSIPDSICLQCLTRNCLLYNLWYMANIHSFIHSVTGHSY